MVRLVKFEHTEAGSANNREPMGGKAPDLQIGAFSLRRIIRKSDRTFPLFGGNGEKLPRILYPFPKVVNITVPIPQRIF